MVELEEIKVLLKNFFVTKPVVRAWIFGSYARGEQTADSDLDILVDYDKSAKLSLFGLATIICDLERLTGFKIDLVDHSKVYPYVEKFIDKDKILVYERNLS